jgi:hypothetical protein
MTDEQFNKLIKTIKNGFEIIAFILIILIFIQACSGPSKGDVTDISYQIEKLPH